MNNHIHDHFKVIRKDYARGVHGIISIVKRISDGKVIIWKRPISSDYRHQMSFEEEIEKSRYWRKFGVSKVKVCWHNDKHSLLKTYIKGPTLKKMLKGNDLCFSKPNSPQVKALGDFIEHLIDSGHYIQDINRQNLVYDGKKWHIIDSSAIHEKTNHSELKHKYISAFMRSWSKSLSDDEKHFLKLFLDKYCK